MTCFVVCLIICMKRKLSLEAENMRPLGDFMGILTNALKDMDEKGV